MAISIGDLARRTDTKVVTIRYYEQIGLLPEPERAANNYRAYGPAHGDRLRFIRRARALGFSLEEIRALLDLSEDTSRECTDVDIIARRHLVAVEAKLKDLKALQRELKSIVTQCGCGTISECRIIESLSDR